MKRNFLWMALVSAGLTLSACDKESSGGGANQDGGNDDNGGASASEGGGGTLSGGSADDGATSDATTGAEDEGGATAGEDSGGNVFIVPPDGGSVALECSVWDQDCPDGEKCMPWANDGGNSWNATKCTPVDSAPAQPGDVCTVEGSGVSGVDNCDVGVMCWDVDPETNEGTCVAMCEGSEQAPVCSDPDTSCVIVNDGVLILCLGTCDPLQQDCPEGQACYGTGEDFVCVPDASGEEDGAYGSPCEYANACDPGFACFGAAYVPDCTGSEGCCTPFCDLSADAASVCVEGAAGGQECIPWYEEGMAPPGYENVGICGIPQA